MDPELIDKLTAAKDELEVREIIDNRDVVLGRFSPAFQPGTVAELDKDVFRDFLSFEQNKHWTGLERQPQLYADMDGLRQVLSVLVDEARPIRERVNTVVEAPGMGVAKLSAILLVAYPRKYGVWNGTSEKALRSLGLWPETRRGATTGERYVAVNLVLLDLARNLEIDLWTLDAIWWGIDIEGAAPKPVIGPGKVRTGDGKAIALANMKYSILSTVQHSNGQTAEVTVKNKGLKMLDRELEALLSRLLEQQKECCAITHLPFQYEGDKNMLPSADRIDSSGHYEEANLQLVCRFINFWKQATPDDEFRRLIGIVRDSGDLD